MNVTSAITRLNEGRPYLSLVVNGREASVYYDDKSLLYGWGCVFLGADWEDRLPPRLLPPDPGAGRTRPQRLTGWTDDAEVLRLANLFYQSLLDDTFQPGVSLLP
jgi:hypothetical protein